MKTNQKGFTLIEILAVTGVGGALIVVLVPFVFNVVTGHQLIRSNLDAVQEIAQAARSISTDGMMAEIIVADGGNLTLEWGQQPEAVGEPHQIKYYLSGTELKREFYNDNDGTWDLEKTTILAQYISHLEFSFSPSDRVITVVIASTPEGVPERTEWRTYRVHLRPVEPVEGS